MVEATTHGTRPAWWNWISSALIALAVVLAAWLLREEIAYFFNFGGPQALGRAEEMKPAALEHNRYVEISGIARDMCIRSQALGRKVRFSYFMGSEAAGRIMIEIPTAGEEEECTGAEERTFQGRLLALSAARRYMPVYQRYRDYFYEVSPPEAMFVLREGVRPLDLWWPPALVTLLAALWVLHFWLLRRIDRRRTEGESDEPKHL